MSAENKLKVYAVDFDGYLCENAWPEIGEPHTAIIEHFKRIKADGNKLILWTCREGEMLRKAANWCMARGLYFDAYNSNLPELNALYGNDCRKIGADYYCDDKNYWLMPDVIWGVDLASGEDMTAINGEVHNG